MFSYILLCCIMLVIYYNDHNDILFLGMRFTNHEWYAPKLKKKNYQNLGRIYVHIL